ncbi:sensor domain-containing diguanylate cyclase [Chitinolyticbacter albus]|uniref:sensor domain-containing diguanylate cyclase n=1 Tax=Chitinolyticbacter albus TaxID=2961951 RepID=UPI00210F2028|nr:GGDEF domain-containing protein [Chitinolyticbacter albus]
MNVVRDYATRQSCRPHSLASAEGIYTHVKLQHEYNFTITGCMEIVLNLELTIAGMWAVVGLLACGNLSLLSLGHRERGLAVLACGAVVGVAGSIAYFFNVPVLAFSSLVLADALLLIGGRAYLGQTTQSLTVLPWPLLAAAVYAYVNFQQKSALVQGLCFALSVLPLALMHVSSLMPRTVEERWAPPRQLFAVIHVLHAAYWIAVAMAWLVGSPGAWAQLPFAYLPPLAMLLLSALAWPQLVSQRLRSRISRLARFDALTGALNRRGLEEAAMRELRRVRKHQGQLGLLLIDMDRFRTLNGRYGHGAGDMALRACTDAVREHVGRNAYLGRVGGEEFCIVAPGVDEAELEALLVTVRQAVADLEVEYDDLLIRFSASASLARFGHDGTDFDTLYRVAAKRISHEKKGPIAFADTAPQSAVAA